MTFRVPRHTNASDRGFSLFEMLVVIAILSVVTGMATQAFFSMTSAWHDTKSLADMDAAAYRAFEQMEEDFADVVSQSISGVAIIGAQSNAQDPRFFQRVLDDDRIVLPVETLGAGGRLESMSVKYAVERQGSGEATLVRTVGLLGSEAPVAGRLVVVDGYHVIRLRFEYKVEGTNEWRSDWTNEGLPAAVRVSMTLMDPNDPARQLSRKAVFSIHVR